MRVGQREKGQAGAPEAYQGVRRRAGRRPGAGRVHARSRWAPRQSSATSGSRSRPSTPRSTNLSQAAKRYPGTVQLSPAQQTQATLSWLIRFQVNEELAHQAGITVSAAQAQKALAQIYARRGRRPRRRGCRTSALDLILAANGIPPNLATELGRYQAIETSSSSRPTGARYPPRPRRQTAAGDQLQHGSVRGGQGPEHPGQPAVRSAETTARSRSSPRPARCRGPQGRRRRHRRRG